MLTSYLDCKHTNIQSYTEYCLDCGYNVYTTKEQYKNDLIGKIRRLTDTIECKEIRDLEDKLRVLTEKANVSKL